MTTRPTTRLRDAALDTAALRHERMMVEARRIIDAGNDSDVTLRLTGGLAVRHYAIDLAFAERDYSDIDLIGRKKQAGDIHELFATLGYQENLHVAMATGNSQRQYFKPAEPLESRSHLTKRTHAGPVLWSTPPSDHIDVFLDTMRMDHEIDFRDRLDMNTYAIDPADLFLSKLQIVNINEKDVHDIITLCKDVYVDSRPHPGVLDLDHVATVCADDWGLYIDTMSNIDTVMERLDDYDLSPHEASRVNRTLELAQDMMTENTKTLRWRMRARIGKRLRWYNEVEEQFGGRTAESGSAVRTKAGQPARAGEAAEGADAAVKGAGTTTAGAEPAGQAVDR